MAAFDGSIVINTKLDQSGFNKGVQGLGKSLAGVLNVVKIIAKLMAAAFIGGSIINNLRSITQSFDIMGSAVGEKIRPLTDALATLKGTFVNLIVQAFIPLIPYIVSAVEWFTKMLSTVTQVVAALFGYKQTVGNIMTQAASDAKKAGKEVKGALAAFDQINVLQKKEADATGGETGPTATPAPITIPQELLDRVEAFKQKVMDFIKPAIELFDQLKKKFDEVFGAIAQWIKENPEKFKILLIVLGLLVVAFLAIVAIIWLFTTAAAIATAVTTTFAAVMALLASPVLIIIIIIGLLIAILIILALNWDTIKGLALGTWETIKQKWGEAAAWFTEHVVEPLKENFTKALDWIKEKFFFIFNSIKDFVKNAIDGIIGYIASLVQSILNGIATISGLSGPGAMGGAAGAVNLRPARLPGLATGAVIPPNAQFAAILGDQRSGRNIEAPEPLIRQIFREEMQGLGGEIKIDNNLYLDGEVIYKNQKKVQTRHGKSLISG